MRLLIGAACLLASAIRPAGAEDFYKGKTITLMVGSAEGGGYDQYARLLARHMGKHIAGEPGIVVKNQPGAGGMVMANAMYASVPRDGLTIGMMVRDNPLEPVLGNSAAKFKTESFTWLGTSSRYEDDAFCLVIRADTAIGSIADLQKPGRPAIFGSQAAGGSETDIVLIARDVFKLNLQLIRGYRSSADVPRGAPNGAIGPAAIRRLSLPGHHPAQLGLGAPQDATGAERCAVSVGPVDRMFATPPDSPGQCAPGLSDDRPRDPRLCYCPELSPRATRSSSS